MKKYAFLLIALLCAACDARVVFSEGEAFIINSTKHIYRSGATFSSFSVEAFTEMDPTEGDGYQFHWTLGDYLAVNRVVYKASNCREQSAMFTPHTNDDEAPAGETSPYYEAVFPHTITTTANREGRNYLSSTVSYKEGELGKFPIFATSDHDTLHFRCVTGALRLKIRTQDTPVSLSQIRLVANNADGSNRALSDEFVLVDGAAVSTSSLVGALVMKPNATVGTDEAAFGFPIFPGTYPKLTITLTTAEGLSWSTTCKDAAFQRARITTLHIRPVFGQSADNTLITYTSTDRQVVTPNVMTSPAIVSNTYADGQGKIVLSKPLTALQAKAFLDCATLRSIELPESVTKIGSNAFQNCTALRDIMLPSQLTELGVNVLNGCALEEIAIPSAVEKIGNKALANNPSLKTLDLPESVLLLDTNALLNDNALETLVVRRYSPEDASAPITVMNGKGVIQGCTALRHIYVPEEAVQAYRAAEGWSSKADIITAVGSSAP